ncbi:MAG: class I SAM-dependent methyltransferase [Promethearchaeota archaeon]
MNLSHQNYYIKQEYIPIREKNKIKEKQYWTSSKISQSFYTQYSVYQFCRDIIKKNNIKTVLDIGCGPATKLMKLIYPICPNIYGIDKGKIIHYCKRRYGLNTFFEIDLEHLKKTLNHKFDLIICADVIEHLKNPDNLINFIKKHTHNNTYIIISTPERDILRGKNCLKSPKEAHIREWNRNEFNLYIRKSGLKVLCHQIVQSFRIFLNLQNTPRLIINDIITQAFKIGYLKGRKKINHTQLIVCKLNNFSNDEMRELCLNFKKKTLKKIIKQIIEMFYIKGYLLIFKILKNVYQ